MTGLTALVAKDNQNFDTHVFEEKSCLRILNSA